IFFFFFSSRRRHTSFSRDWSSDVCSSDLQVEICNEALCKSSYSKLIEQNHYFVISDVDKHYKASNGTAPYNCLYDQKIKSALLRSEERRVGKECRARWGQ